MNKEPLGPVGSSLIQPSPSPPPHSTARPLPPQPRSFIPTPLCCDAVAISGRTELRRCEQHILKGRRSDNQPACQCHLQSQVTWRGWQEPFILLFSLCTSLGISPAPLSSHLLVLLPSVSLPLIFPIIPCVSFTYFLHQSWTFVFFLSLLQLCAANCLGPSSDPNRHHHHSHGLMYGRAVGDRE